MCLCVSKKKIIRYSLFSILIVMSLKKYRFYVLFVSICFFIDPSVSRGQALKIQHDLVVAKDGSGDYRYIHWSRPETETTAYYAEYKCVGLGFKPQNRVKWAHQLTDKEAEIYTMENILLEN